MAACTLQLPERIVLHAYGMAMRCLGSIPIEPQILQAMAPVSEIFGGVNVTSRMSWALGCTSQDPASAGDKVTFWKAQSALM